MSKNRNKFCRLFNFDIEHEKLLDDDEVRFFHLMLRVVDWDKRHTDTYGSIKITVRELKEYLPWAIGKISPVINSLIARGWLERKERSRISIRSYWIYRIRSVPKAEQLVQQLRQGVQIPEPPVQPAEKDGFRELESIRKLKEEIARKMKL